MNNIIDDKFKNFILSPDDYNFEKLLQDRVWFGENKQGSYKIWPSAKYPGYYYVDRVVIDGYIFWAECSKKPMSKDAISWWIKKYANDVQWKSHKWDGKEFNYLGERPRKMRISIVYFIEAVGTEFVKIGRGIDRIEGLRTGCPFPLRLLGQNWSNDAPRTEKMLHERFSKYHHINEWYYLTDEILEYINNTKDCYYDYQD